MSKTPCSLIALAAVALLAGCEGTDLTGDPRLPAYLDPARGAKTKLAKISGGGRLARPDLPVYFNFSVKQTAADGAAKGKLGYYVTFGGELVDFTGKATCLSADPVNRRAWEYSDTMPWPADDEGTAPVTQGNIQLRD